MVVDYSVTGEKRKELASLVSTILDQPLTYLGPPTFSYTVGGYTVDRTGKLICDDETSDLKTAYLIQELREKGFASVSVDYGRDTIFLMKADLTPDAVGRLLQIVANKKELFEKAFDAESIPVHEEEKRIAFPWFKLTGEVGEGAAYAEFVSALATMAKNSKRVIDKPYTGDNDKFAMRTFLIRLGLTGPEHKTTRKILLRYLTGNGSWRHGH